MGKQQDYQKLDWILCAEVFLFGYLNFHFIAFKFKKKF